MEAVTRIPAGLEVVHPPPQLNHVASESLEDTAIATKEPYSTLQVRNGYTDHASNDRGGFWSRRRMIWFIILGAFLIIAAVVVGAILGTRSHSGSAATTTVVTVTSVAPSATPSATSTANSLIFKKGSALSVSGWRTGNEFSIRLFYQGNDSIVRVSKFESLLGKWAAPTELFKGAQDTPLASSDFRRGSEGGYTSDNTIQTEMFSLNSSGFIVEWSTLWPSQGGGIGSKTAKIGLSTRMAFYWPNLFYQDTNGALRQYFYSISSPNEWTDSPLTGGVIGTNRSGLGVMPRNQNYSSLSVFYQRDDGKLAEYYWVGGNNGPPSYGWATGAILDVIPMSTPLGVFSTPRGDNSSVNQYVLWQDTSGDIQVKWLDDTTGWKGPATYPALQGADKGTSIACLTPSSGYSIQAVAKTDMCRCYFQVGGVIREVAYANRNWTILGYPFST